MAPIPTLLVVVLVVVEEGPVQSIVNAINRNKAQLELLIETRTEETMANQSAKLERRNGTI